MKNLTLYSTVKLAVAIAVTASLTSCTDTVGRLSEVGNGPKLTKITNPTATPEYRPVSMPMPTPEIAEENPNSLWRAGARAFFKDHRAKEHENSHLLNDQPLGLLNQVFLFLPQQNLHIQLFLR